LQASDPDGDSITFQITGGSDQSSFTINNSGQVLFLSSPDYENPSDANFDNSYEVVIRAFDGSLYSSNYDFIVNITNDESDDGSNNSSAVCSDQSESTSYCTIDWDNLEREFYAVFPESHSLDQSYPLLISLHGGDDYADANMQYTGFTQINDENNFVLIFPQGTVAAGKGSTGWYSGGDCSNIEVCDLSFIERLIDYSIEELAIDPSRVYVSGFSNGAFMAYTTACFLSNKVAAVAPVSGSLSPEDYESCDPKDLCQ
jgi:polyhydroxybutyrate depolymerase